jgi:hypothetical protein
MSETDDIRVKAQAVIALKSARYDTIEERRNASLYMGTLAEELARLVIGRLDEPRSAGVTHEEARAAYASLNVDPDTGPLGVYIRQQAERDRAHAELERRAREVVTSRHLPTSGEGVPVRRVMAAIDALAELLGERSDSSEGGRG